MSYTIKQISIFAENKPGRLAAIAEVLEAENINIMAFSIAEASGFGVVRALVDDPEKAYRKLTDLGYVVSTTEVIGVKMHDRPGGLREISRMLGDAGINIEYAYAYSGRPAAVLILRVDQVQDAIKVILGKGGQLLKRDELA
ncbi:MAG: ACT domain-containing protein [Methanomassiliicoccus sp.]|nr:ACT domain-containing protein [Methanomassiliicoccus sp.]